MLRDILRDLFGSTPPAAAKAAATPTPSADAAATTSAQPKKAALKLIPTLDPYPAATPKPRHDIAVVIPTICRQTLLRSVRCVFAQQNVGKIQLLIGVDCDPNNRYEAHRRTLEAECPDNVSLFWLHPGYSTSTRHGGLHSNHYGGSIVSALFFLADAEIVVYLDDDDWLDNSHCADILATFRDNDCDWAWARSYFANGDEGVGLCIDEFESCGVDAGHHADTFGGYVRPSGIALHKLNLSDILHLWSFSPFPTGDGCDRLIFDRLRKAPGACTGKATVYYTMDPRDMGHPYRVNYLRARGTPEEAIPRQRSDSVR